MPRVGETYRGGVYAGITKDSEDLVFMFPHAIGRDVIASDADKALTDGWRLPKPHESALLFANAKGYFDDRWYWTSEPYPPDPELCRWVQSFGYGRQADARVTDACRVVMVKTFPREQE